MSDSTPSTLPGASLFAGRAAAQSELLENAPPPGRALAQVGLVLASVFLPAAGVPMFGKVGAVGAGVALLVWGLALLRPWSQRARLPGRAFRVLSLPLLLLAVGGAVASSAFGDKAPPPRLGVNLGPAGAGQVEIVRVLPGTPASGLLVEHDRVLSLSGEALSPDEPLADFQRKVAAAGEGKETALRLEVQREGERREVTVRLPAAGPKMRAFTPGSMLWLCLRALGVSLLVGLLVWSDGQGPRQLGFARAGLGRELLLGGPVMLGAYAAHLAATIPLSLLATLLHLAKDEALVRKELATSLAGGGLGIPTFAAAMVLIASFEELAFRGFLVPRLRQVVGRWWLAVLLSSVLFGLGHVYEGTLATVQTAVLGAYFGAVFLLRFRLASVMVAHGLFNTLNFALMVWMQRSGLLEKLSEGLPK